MIEINNIYEIYPKFVSYNKAIGHIVGECLCGNYVKNTHNYCYNCGIKLNWQKIENNLEKFIDKNE